jgi:hypothetical protein
LPDKPAFGNHPRVEWYHVKDGQRLGPHNEEQFAALVKTGQIVADTLVWNSGMAEWQAYGVMTGGSPPVQTAVQSLGPWRSGATLVLTPGLPLPNRCVKCNAPTERKLKRNLQWHNPLLYLLVCAGLLIYVIVALVLRKTAKIEIGLCDVHFKKRRMAMLICWGLFIGGIGGFVLAGSINKGWPALAGLVAILASAVYAAVGTSPVSPKKIDDKVWLNGCGKEYLAELPEWPYPTT